MKYFNHSLVLLLLDYILINTLFIVSLIYREYSWWLMAGACAILIFALFPIVIIIKYLFGGRYEKNRGNNDKTEN